MGETATVTEPTPQTLDQQLDELFKGPGPKEPVAPGGSDKADAGKPGPDALPDPDKTKEAPTEDPIEKALADIKDEEPKKEDAAPKLTDEQQAVLRAIPTPQEARNLFQVVENYQNFVTTFESGDFENVETMFQNWNPTAYENFIEHIYQQYMVNGDWAERFIAEAEGRGSDRKQYKELQKQIKDLEAKQKQKEAGEAQRTQAAENARIAQAYENYVNGLFDTINFSKADRKWVFSDLNARVGADPKVMQAVRSGNLSAINSAFKAAVREYVNRDKQVNEEKDKKIVEQSQKKPLVAGGVGTPGEGELPSDVKQVPKGQEDNWMMQELGKLAKKVGLKK